MTKPIYAPDAIHPSLRDTFSSLAVASISSMIKDKSGKIAGYAEATLCTPFSNALVQSKIRAMYTSLKLAKRIYAKRRRLYHLIGRDAFSPASFEEILTFNNQHSPLSQGPASVLARPSGSSFGF